MSSDSIDQQRNELEALAEDYVGRKRRGERPSLDSYIADHPELADDIRELFPVVEMLDQPQLKQTGATHGSIAEIGPGARLGEYELIRCIGRGGMGVVYQAEHIVLGSQVAIKVLPGDSGRPKLRERFQREASAAARMHHPNIVRVFDFGAHGETLYYVMSLVDGWGLHRVLRSTGVAKTEVVDQAGTRTTNQPTPTRFELASISSKADSEHSANEDPKSHDTIPIHVDRTGLNSVASDKNDDLWSWVARLGVQAADALDYAHSMGVIHRDIKPANLMLDAENHLYITDFGLAKVGDDSDLTATGDILGTLRYMPPEAFAGRADSRSDIYALGLTLYELLAGRPAFLSSDRVQLVPAITEGKIPRLRAEFPKIPLDLETIVHKAIDVDPSHRYQSAADMRDDVQRFLNGEPVAARRLTVTYQAARWIGRNRTVSILAGCLIAFLTITAITASVSAGKFRNLAEEKRQESVAAKKQTRVAQLNLLSSLLSDAKGWSTSGQPGQRVEGIKSLEKAIALSRDLDVFADVQDEINEVAVTLGTLADVPRVSTWRHPVPLRNYTALAFNADLSVYGIYAASKNDAGESESYHCEFYRVEGDKPTLIESVDLKNWLREYSMCLSADANVVSAIMRDSGGSYRPWIYNRRTMRHFLPEYQWQDRGSPSPKMLGNSVVVFVTRDHFLVGFDAHLGKETFKITLPDEQPWSHVSLNRDGTQALVFSHWRKDILAIDLRTQEVHKIGFSAAPVWELDWHPDGHEFAIMRSDEQITLWDLESDKAARTIHYSHSVNTQCNYLAGGRLLMTTGWDRTSVVHDSLSAEKVMRCEALLRAVSEDGNRIALLAQSQFEIHPVIASSIVRDFFTGHKFSGEASTVSAEQGLAWISPPKELIAIDLLSNRILERAKRSPKINLGVAVDPRNRDVFATLDSRLIRLPVSMPDQKRGEKTISIGPPQTLWTYEKDKTNFNPESVSLDSRGEKLGVSSLSGKCEVVLKRDRDWKVSSHTHAVANPIAVRAHPTLPLVATTVHNGNRVEVRNTETGEVEFQHFSKACSTKFDPKGDRLLVCSNGRLRSFRIGTWEKLAETPSNILIGDYSFQVSSDGQWVAIENTQPRGVLILHAETLKPALSILGAHSDPQTYVADFDSTGRFLVTDRGKRFTGIWDLHELRKHFESLDLPWPLPGMGKPTPLRDPSVDVEILWEEKSKE